MPDSTNDKLAAALGRTPQCPPFDELVAATRSGSAKDADRRLRAHVDGCHHCRTELALFQEFESPSLRPGEQAAVNAIVDRLRTQSPAPREAWWTKLWNPRFLAPAALALTAALIALTIGLHPAHSIIAPYTPRENETVRSAAVTAVSPIGDVDTAVGELVWQPYPGARTYRVRVVKVDRHEIWNATVSSTRAALPENVARQVAPLKTLLWEVAAIDGSGDEIGSSGLQTFRLLR